MPKPVTSNLTDESKLAGDLDLAEAAGLSLKNKKAELLEALNAALQREQDLKNSKYDPVAEAKTRETERKIQETRKNVEANVFSTELNQKFRDLEAALVAEETKLKELYGIEAEIESLTAAVNASQAVLEKFESEKQQQMRELDQKLANLEADYAEKSRLLKQEREREAEEYDYNLKRERAIDRDDWQAEKSKREQILAEKEMKTLELLKEAEEKSAHIKSLEEQIEKLPEQLEAEYARGRTEATAELNREHKFATELLKKDYQSQLDRQSDQITALTQELQKLTAEKDTALEKLDRAYAQVKDMATRTVEASGGVKILNNDQHT